MKRITFRSLTAGFLLAVLLLATVFVFWANDAYPASATALEAMQTDSHVIVKVDSGYASFSPVNDQPSMGFIFYPGARVDYRAYAPLLKQIAARGFFVAIMPAPLNFAVLNVTAAEFIRSRHPEIQQWVVGGHSLGGVAAAEYDAGHKEIAGVVFWGSFPGNDALKKMDVPVLSVYGTRDGLTTLQLIEDSKDLLPADAQFVAIEGGNHSQFASYGFQSGDHEAEITAEEQWAQVANATADFLERLFR